MLEAQEDDPAALAAWCRAYWFPLFCFACRLRPSQEDAQDLTQAFFEMLLSRQGLKRVRVERGKLRSFLLASMRNFAAEQYRKEQAQRRGGGIRLEDLEAVAASPLLTRELRTDLSPEREFDRAWARQLLSTVLGGLREAYHTAGKGALFDALQGHVTGGDTQDYAAAAQALGISVPATRYAAFKLRQRYQEKLRVAIQQTVATPEEVAEELHYLRELFAT